MGARGPVGYTCPLIDKCISIIEGVIRDPDSVEDLSDLVGRHGVLENIRDHNSQLRDWGAENEDKVAEVESENRGLEATIEDLNDRIQNLEHELEHERAKS